MKKYRILIEPSAVSDIREISDWFEEAQKGLGGRFAKTAIKTINSLKKDPHIYAIRYKEIRCALVKKFPYLAHYYINESNSTVEVLAVISTHRDPDVWGQKTTRST